MLPAFAPDEASSRFSPNFPMITDPKVIVIIYIQPIHCFNYINNFKMCKTIKKQRLLNYVSVPLYKKPKTDLALIRH